MYKFFLKFFFLSLLFAQLNCSGKKSQEAVRIPKNPGSGPQNNKEDVTDVAPTFAESQLQKNQSITWKRTSPNGTFDCMRWTIVDFPAQGVALKGQSSKNCKDYDDKFTELIIFNAASGEVDPHLISLPDSSQVYHPHPLTTIFDHLYGNQQKVTFQRGLKKWEKNDLPAFWLKQKPTRVFLNLPGTPFHAFVISWIEDRENGKWKFELKETNPPLLPIPANPMQPQVDFGVLSE